MAPLLLHAQVTLHAVSRDTTVSFAQKEEIAMNKIGSLLFVLGMFATVGCAASTEEPAPSSDGAKTPEEAAAKEAKAPPAVQLDNVASQAAPAPKLPPSCVCLVNADGTPTDLCYCY